MKRAPRPAEIRALRDRLGLSQAQAAELVHSPVKSFQNWEQGRTPMHPAIFELLGVKGGRLKI